MWKLGAFGFVLALSRFNVRHATAEPSRLAPSWLALVLALGLAVAPASFAAPCKLDNAPDARWRVAREGAVAWLQDPCGKRFLSIGVNVLDGGLSGEGLNRPHYHWRHQYPSKQAWIQAARARLEGWGFNSAGAWSLSPDELRLPGVIDLELGRTARFHWFDPFDPEMSAIMDATARRLTAPWRGSAWRIGYFSDNEVGWWSGALFTFYAAQPASSHTKQRLIQLLRQHYHDDWQAFVADFVVVEGLKSWKNLLENKQAVRLRIGGEGERVIAAWTALVAGHYYRLSAEAIRKADPGALYFGDRLPIYYDPAAVRAGLPFVDVLSVNYNPDSPDGWIAQYFFDGLRQITGGKPILISEWFFAATENRSGNCNNGHLMTVATQAERARGAAAAARNFASIPEVLGLHWFQYYDYPQGGRADKEDYSFGLVDIADRPYEDLVAALGAANHALANLHAAGSEPPRGHSLPPRQGRDGFVLPYARIKLEGESLADWPKPASLLPPLVAEPGAVAFGELYAAWDERGLAVALLAQDYVDLELLEGEAEFPLAEAFRVEIGIDAGPGVRYFTLGFIPPRRAARDYPPMTPRLCLGAAALVSAETPAARRKEPASVGHARPKEICAPVPGAEVRYFGADQPRIVAEALLPWQALGLDGPPTSPDLRLDAAVWSWFNARWMSLSGRLPGQALADSATWFSVRRGPKPGEDRAGFETPANKIKDG